MLPGSPWGGGGDAALSLIGEGGAGWGRPDGLQEEDQVQQVHVGDTAKAEKRKAHGGLCCAERLCLVSSGPQFLGLQNGANSVHGGGRWGTTNFTKTLCWVSSATAAQPNQAMSLRAGSEQVLPLSVPRFPHGGKK